MDLSSLKIFMAVAQTGSVSAASQKMNYVQSNVTARIKKLEEEIGLSLFQRKSRGMSLTQEGRVLENYAQQMIDLEQQAINAVRASVEDGGQIALGAMETAMAVRLPHVLKAFHKAYPKTELSVCTGTTDEMIERVITHQLDCAIVGSPVQHSQIEQFPFFSEKLVLVAAPGQQESKTLLVYRKGCAYRARAESWLRSIGRLPYSIMEFGTQEGIMGCVSAGLGITLMPESVATQLGNDVEIFDLPADIAHVETYFIFNRSTQKTKPFHALQDLIRASLPEDRKIA